MSQLQNLDYEQWINDTLSNLETIDMYNSDYPVDKLITNMRFVASLFKNHNYDIAKIAPDIKNIPEEDQDRLKKDIGVNIRDILLMLLEAKNLSDNDQLNYTTARAVGRRCMKMETETEKELKNLCYIAFTKPFAPSFERSLPKEVVNHIEHRYKTIHIAHLDDKNHDKYETLLTSDIMRTMLQPQEKCTLNLNATSIPLKGVAGGWFMPACKSLTLQTPDPYILIHETFHLIDHELEIEHAATFSDDERLAFFHELYDILTIHSNTNVINPFDYIEYDKDQDMVYKDNALKELFEAQVTSLSRNTESLPVSSHWMQFWRSKDVIQMDRDYFITPCELLARLYTTAYSLAYPELSDLINNEDVVDNYVDRLTLSAKRTFNDKEALQSKLQNWIARFNDYANATLHKTPRQYASKKMEQLSSDFNNDALTIIRDIQQLYLDKSKLLSTEHSVASNVFSIVHYKNAQINAAFNQHIATNLETYYKAGEFSQERKSHHLLQAFVDFKEGKIPAEDILKKVGFTSVQLDVKTAHNLCEKYQKVLESYDLDMTLNDDIFEYKEAAMYV